MNRCLWILQVLLAVVFLLAGVMKLVTPLDQLYEYLPLPGALTRFIGLAETLGAIGLILPAALRIRPSLTPLAACGLVIIMTGATLLTPTFFGQEPSGAVLPLVLGLFSAGVAYGRFRVAPIGACARRRSRLAASQA